MHRIDRPGAAGVAARGAEYGSRAGGIPAADRPSETLDRIERLVRALAADFGAAHAHLLRGDRGAALEALRRTEPTARQLAEIRDHLDGALRRARADP